MFAVKIILRLLTAVPQRMHSSTSFVCFSMILFPTPVLPKPFVIEHPGVKSTLIQSLQTRCMARAHALRCHLLVPFGILLTIKDHLIRLVQIHLAYVNSDVKEC